MDGTGEGVFLGRRFDRRRDDAGHMVQLSAMPVGE
jgi:hypothetical protein